MKIGIDCRMLGYSGIGRYIQCLIKGIVANTDRHEYILLGNEEKLSDFKRSSLAHVRSVTSPIFSIYEQFEMPLAARGLSLLHVPHYNVPIFYNGRLIVTIHDIIPILFPEFLSSKKARW